MQDIIDNIKNQTRPKNSASSNKNIEYIDSINNSVDITPPQGQKHDLYD